MNSKKISGFSPVQKKKYSPWIILGFIFMVVLISLTFFFLLYSKTEFESQHEQSWQIQKYKEAENKLKIYVFSNSTLEDTILEELVHSYGGNDEYVIFFSLCDLKNQATIIKGKGVTLQEAWSNADNLAQDFIDKHVYNVEWLKADIVNQKSNYLTNRLPDLIAQVSGNRENFFRLGIALDDQFEYAFLEGEINGNNMIDYNDSNSLNLDNFNNYLETSAFKMQEIKSFPDRIVLFTTRGYLFDGKDCYTLHYQPDLNFGRRIINDFSKKYVEKIVESNIKLLQTLIEQDGRFVYGVYPIDDRRISGYNILRHAGTVWAMLELYGKSYVDIDPVIIESALSYLVSEIELDPDNLSNAYIVERRSNDIKLGGNALAILALTEYTKKFNDYRYLEICEKLGNGILNMMDLENGMYMHVLFFNEEGQVNFSLKDKFRTVFYDGEATFALLRLYELTGDQRFLEAAIQAVDYFILNDYIKYKDHWVAYSLNELTKYVDDQKYVEFALRNVAHNFTVFFTRPTLSHTDLELLMSTFLLYDRIIENEIKVDYLNQFDAKRFVDAIFYRAENMLNGYFYPEVAMYFKKPDSIVGAFFVRHDGFRVRIDDIQHSVAGYSLFEENYDKLLFYRNKYN